ncbi:MAG: sigma-70 family RNA polymerase sigma factor [Bacteroidetes bacterium]|nr:sigma-70 family RNA polymerase sigma factor [Bacteroidota bacterium]MCB0842068.1 sigma-70 family RNA polymerase sigma factor [Bacteroidota bacterium]MCB0853055.1 sigma-70 family RNA polymerase sigma factor [Bacteroidota bacterium]
MTKDNKQLSDEVLIEAITQKGETELFGILYDRYSNKVYRKCLSFVKDESAAQDMVQDVLLKVFTQLGKFQGKSRFSTWLYAITYNYCVEYYRKNNKYAMVDIDEGPDISVDDDDEKELLKMRAEQLKWALDQVAPEDKMILLLKYQDDTPIKEIMDTLDISESAVKMRLARARQRVKQVVQEREKVMV